MFIDFTEKPGILKLKLKLVLLAWGADLRETVGMFTRGIIKLSNT